MRSTRYLLIGIIAALVLLTSLSVFAKQRAMTLADMIATDDDYTTLRRLLNAAPDVAALLDDPSAQLTFYAPTEAAYNRLFSDSMMTVEWYLRHPAEIEIMLLQQIVPVAFSPANGYLTCRSLGTMLPENWLLLDLEDGELSINFEPIDSSAARAANGLLIPIDYLFPRFRLIPAAGDHSPDGSGGTPPDPRLDATAELHPADGDIRTILETDGRFTRWLSLLDEQPDVLVHLTSAGVYTLFIPTDTTFDAHLAAEGLDLNAFIESNPSFAGNSIAPGYNTPELLLTDITFNEPDFCTLDPEGVIRTSDDSDGTYVDGVPLTGETLYANNAVIYVIDGVRPPAVAG